MTVKLVDCLVERLNSKGIIYCHWKSNFSLTQALSGEMDLDLLVDRKSLPQVLTILMHLGFKPATVIRGPGTPGVYHYYGFDPQADQFIHLHLFGRVLTGESFVKSHVFPFETMLLENIDHIGRIRVASKPAELVLFTLRMFIKYGSLLDLVYLLRDSENIVAELQWLRADSDISEALCLLKKYCPVIDEPLFSQCIDALNGHSSLIKQVILARNIRRRLRVYAKDTALKRALLYVQVLWGQIWRRLRGNKKNKMLTAGGAVIAFIGPEATGKSTFVSACELWLGDAFVARSVHAGKPPSSWLTSPINVVIPLVRSLLPQLRTSRLEGHASSTKLNRSASKNVGLSSLIYALGAVTVAWDRRRLLLKVRRSAAKGEIVICDRYPSEEVGAMDSPRLQQNLTEGGLIAAIYNFLARLEGRLYKQIPPPDIVLRLRVSIETAKRRNRERIKPGKETDAYLESRHRQSQDWRRAGTKYIYDIDTERPLNETILSVKQVVWESL